MRKLLPLLFCLLTFSGATTSGSSEDLEASLMRSANRLIEMTEAEENGDTARYMELVALEANEKIQSDREMELLLEKVKEKRMPSYHSTESHFTESEKVAMLANAHGLSAQETAQLKAEIEVMFEDEFRERYRDEE